MAVSAALQHSREMQYHSASLRQTKDMEMARPVP